MYIMIAPYNMATGGVELAHQMCAEINKWRPGCAKMAYYDNEDDSFRDFPIDHEGPAVYDKYKVTHVRSMEEIDCAGNIVIVPEGITPLTAIFKMAKKVVWWMSVDWYLNCFEGCIPTNLDQLQQDVDLHIYQSEYARDFLETNLPQAVCMPVSDYINEIYGTFLYPGAYRKNIVLYNPRKGLEVVQEIQKAIPEVEWVQIVGLSPEEVMVLMQSAKLYVDFGNHPGKDRIPREAVSNGCCVITNKTGSAAFYEDVPIGEEYKFEDPIRDVEQLRTLILDICDHYEDHWKNFEAYRLWVKDEHRRFSLEVYQFIRFFEPDTEINTVEEREGGMAVCANIPGLLFEDAAVKNEILRDSGQELLIYANADVTQAEEIRQIIDEYPYMEETSVLVLCKNVPVQNDVSGILAAVDMEIYGMVIKREVFAQTGAFNECLKDETNREFLCRAASVCSPVFLECTDVEWKKSYTGEVEMAHAYLLVRYLQELKTAGLLESMLELYTEYAMKQGNQSYFETCLQELMSPDQSLYQNLYLNTAPFLMIRGSDICYGMLQNFADGFTEALIRKGQRVVIADGDECDPELLQKERFRGIIGFQATILQKQVFDSVRGRRFNFWFDHPMFFHALFAQMDQPVTYLCQDGEHADYINRNCSPGTGVQFPPGVRSLPWTEEEKCYDIAFMGTYFDPDRMWETVNSMESEFGEMAREVADYLLQHPSTGYNEVAELVMDRYRTLAESYPREAIMEHIWEACRIAPYTYRSRVVRTILDAGLELHVYGDSWKNYPRREGDRLICHEAIQPQEIAQELRKSKIALNVMSWHKAGMTERILEIMMAGSVCLTDRTSYLSAHFHQMQDIVMFDLEEIGQLPELIRKLLADEQQCKRIAKNAYERVTQEFTWDERAAELIAYVSRLEEETYDQDISHRAGV